MPEQIVGVKHLLSSPRSFYGGFYKQDEPIGTLLFDEQGVAKTRQAIDAACCAFEAGVIDTVIVVAPASVRGVWDVPDADLGEIAKYCWVPYQTSRLDSKHTSVDWASNLQWLITSYGFTRKKQNHSYPAVEAIKKLIANRKVWLIFDESSYIKSHNSMQSLSAVQLRNLKGVVRVTELNGTPIGNTPLDLWNQFAVCDPQMIAVNPQTKDLDVNGEPLTFTQFRARFFHLTLKSLPNRRPFYEVVGENREELTKLKTHVKPWILRRLLKNVLNIPDVIYTYRESQMSNEAWSMYKDMRDTLVAFFRDNPSQAKNGAVKTIRLAQLTSGFIGGVEILSEALKNSIEWDDNEHLQAVEIDDSKLQTFLEYRETLPSTHPVITWCRFTKELKRTSEALRKRGHRVGEIFGGQSDSKRQEQINAFRRGQLDDLVGNAGAGGIGLNLTAAHVEVYQSQDHSLTKRLQSVSRVQRRGQTEQVYVVDIAAVGPKGQKTIDHAIIKALRQKKDTAEWTSSDWIKALKYE